MPKGASNFRRSRTEVMRSLAVIAGAMSACIAAVALPGFATGGVRSAPLATSRQATTTAAASRVAATTATTRATTRPARLKVASYNIEFRVRANAFPKVVKAILAADADVVAIQEGNGELFRHLTSKLGRQYRYRKYYPGRAAHGMGWLSKVPLTEMKLSRGKAGGTFDLPTAMATVKLDGKKICLVNVHLYPSLLAKGETILDMPARFRKCEKVRTREIARILAALPKKQAAILMGDFNTLSTGDVAGILRKQGFIDSLASVTAKPDKTSTWRYGGNAESIGMRVDYIWHSPQLKTFRCRVIDQQVSDHLPVTAELEWKKDPASKPADR